MWLFRNELLGYSGASYRLPDASRLNVAFVPDRGKYRGGMDAPVDVFSAASASITNPSTLRSRVYVIGGRPARLAGPGRITAAVRRYDVTVRTWGKVANLPVRLTDSNGAVEIGGKIYLSGGFTRRFDEQFGVYRYEPVRSLYVYNPGTNQWTRKRDMPIPTTTGFSAAYEGKLYVASQCYDETYCGAGYGKGALWSYEPASDRWTLLGRSPHRAPGPGGGFIGGKLYLVSDGGELDIYNPATGTWSNGPAAFTEFCALPGITFQSKLYLVGCSDDGTTLVFDPKTGLWTSAAPRPSEGSGPLSRVTVNGQRRLQMVGGERPGNNWLFAP